MKYWIALTFLCMSFLFCAGSAEAGKLNKNYYKNTVYKCGKWDVVDVSFKIKAEIDKPFGIVFGVKATLPDGSIKTIPGFYDGNNNFILRINPGETGTWNFLTYSDFKELAGLPFGMNVGKSTDTMQHGPVVLSRTHPGKFDYADGEPYFLQAYELDWLFALDADDPGGIPKTKMLIDTVAAYGFNQIIMNVYAYDVDWKKDPALKKEYDYGSPDVYPFGGTNSKPDFSTLNTTFFRRLDRVIEYLMEKNIAAHLMIYVWNKEVNWPPMYSKTDNMYFEYVIKRYEGYPNVIWDIAKEALSYGRCDMNYINDRISRVRKLDAYKRLLTVHDYRYCENYPDKVDFISIQYWGTDLYGRMLSLEEQYKGKPVFNIEHGGYERGLYDVFDGDYTDPKPCLERNYLCAFAGTYSTYYWQNTAWYVVIPDPMSLPVRFRPHFKSYRFFTGFMSKYDFKNLVPEPGVSSSGLCLEDTADATFLFFVPEGNSGISITLAKYAGRNADLKLFDPLKGVYEELPGIKFGGWQRLSIPGGGSFRILVMKIYPAGK